jgi:hypothetical protein
LPHE